MVHSDRPDHTYLKSGVVMTKDGFVFPNSMSEAEMEHRKKSMYLTDSIFTKFEPVYKIADGTPLFTFLVKKTQPSVSAHGISDVGVEFKMEYETPEVVAGSRVLPKKKHTTTVESVSSAKNTSFKLIKESGGDMVKDLDLSGHRTTIVVPPRERTLKVIRAVPRTASSCVFHQVEYQPTITDS